jgi:hypothetical protein
MNESFSKTSVSYGRLIAFKNDLLRTDFDPITVFARMDGSNDATRIHDRDLVGFTQCDHN